MASYEFVDGFIHIDHPLGKVSIHSLKLVQWFKTGTGCGLVIDAQGQKPINFEKIIHDILLEPCTCYNCCITDISRDMRILVGIPNVHTSWIQCLAARVMEYCMTSASINHKVVRGAVLLAGIGYPKYIVHIMEPSVRNREDRFMDLFAKIHECYESTSAVFEAAQEILRDHPLLPNNR